MSEARGLPERRLELYVPATHAAARGARRTATDFARRDGLSSEEVEQLALVLSELLSNAVDHGGGGAARDGDELDGPVGVTLRLWLGDGDWAVEVDDEGAGDAARLAELLAGDPQFALEDERGRGFFLVREMVDALSVRPGAGGLGVCVRAERHRGA